MLAASSGLAIAQPITGLYLGGGTGLNLRETSTNNSGHTSISTNPGEIGVLALGWGFGNGLRAELEGSYRNNQVNQLQTLRVNGQMENTGSITGRVATEAAMANLLYDFNVSVLNTGLRPYIGAGAGYGWQQNDNISGTEPLILNLPGNNVVNGPGRLVTNSTGGQFAYQAIGGIALPLSGVPGLELTAEYRYFGMEHVRQTATATIGSGNSVNGAAQSVTATSYSSDHNHSVLIGLRYAFNAAPPPPPAVAAPVAVPAPAPARTYLVFFDWDRADLTARARSIIKEAADASTHIEHTQLKVNGYTDLSGTAAYNQRLSVRRAQSVAAELVRDGVPQSAIVIQGFGESNPLVPTAQGVREPQNRRVEIIIG